MGRAQIFAPAHFGVLHIKFYTLNICAVIICGWFVVAVKQNCNYHVHAENKVEYCIDKEYKIFLQKELP
jgi:hypothetical protein